MDFAKLVTEYLNQRTEGDPSFIVSEESLAFVDLMRKDDMDRRASSVTPMTSSDARGEPSNEQITEDARTHETSSEGTDAEPSPAVQHANENTEPAATFSDVALARENAAGSISPVPEKDTTPEASEVFTERSGSESEPSPVFTQEGAHAASNEALREEGNEVAEIPNLRGETTIIQPPEFENFSEALLRFDRDYKPPEEQVGDMVIPELDESDAQAPDPLQNTSEFAEKMIADMSKQILGQERSAQ